MDVKVGDEKRTTCASCGEVWECSFVPSPYAYEIAGDDTPDWYCTGCLYEMAMDI